MKIMKISSRTRTTTLERIAADVVDDLQAQNRRASARRLDAWDIEHGLIQHRAALKAAKPGDVAVHTRLYGGFVPSNYKYAANGDTVNIETTVKTGATEITGWWGRGNFSRPHGVGNTRITRIRKKGQSQGRAFNP